MIGTTRIALAGGTALALVAALPASAQSDQVRQAQQASPQGPGAPPVAAGNQATSDQAQVTGSPSNAPQPQGPGSGIANTAASGGSDSGQLEDIVVTATRTATNLQTTPIAVTAVTTDQLTARGAVRLEDAGQFSPSFSAGADGSRIAIRGIGVDTNASQSSVGVYVDDVFYIGTNAIGLFDVDRIEILRGPQGTLFGRNTIGGAVQYVTKKPSTEGFSGYVDAIGGSYGRHDFQGAINVPLGSTLAIRLAGNTQERDGYVYDVYNNRNDGNIFQRQGRAELRWRPSDRFTFDLEGSLYHQSQLGRPNVISAVNPQAQFVGLARLFGETRPLTNAYVSTGRYIFPGYNAPDYSQSDYRSIQGTIQFKLSDQLDLKSISAYQYLKSINATDFDATPLNILKFTQQQGAYNKLLTQEGQLIGHVLNDRLRFTLGVYYFDNQTYSLGVPGVTIGFVTQPSGGDTETDIKSEAVYGQASFDITEALSITGGLRYSHETNTAYALTAGAPRLKSSFNNTAPYVGVNYQPNNHTLFYAKYSEGFKAGGQVVNANLPGGNLPFGPEKAKTWEAGARLELFDRHFRFNPTFFLTDYSDIQFNLLIPTASNILTATQNSGSARIQGFELETQLVASKRLVFTSAISINDSYYKSVPVLTRSIYPIGFPGPVITAPNITVDTPLNRSPLARVSLGGRYTLPVTDTSNLIFNLSGVYTSSQFGAVTISDHLKLPASTVLQARVQYDFGGGKYSVAGFVTNLTDEYYYVAGFATARGYTVGTDQYTPARPREFAVQATVRF